MLWLAAIRVTRLSTLMARRIEIEPSIAVSWRSKRVGTSFMRSARKLLLMLLTLATLETLASETHADVLAYVMDAMTGAHQANPDARLLVNDYRIIVKMPFQRRFKQLDHTLVAQKVPLHAVGIQAHESLRDKCRYCPQELWGAYEMFGTQTGLPIYITEYFQVSDPSQAVRGDHRSGKWDEESQADAIEEFYRVSFGHPSVEAIIYFGLSDSDVVELPLRAVG